MGQREDYDGPMQAANPARPDSFPDGELLVFKRGTLRELISALIDHERRRIEAINAQHSYAGRIYGEHAVALSQIFGHSAVAVVCEYYGPTPPVCELAAPQSNDSQPAPPRPKRPRKRPARRKR
jgi:hypothetical protein